MMPFLYPPPPPPPTAFPVLVIASQSHAEDDDDNNDEDEDLEEDYLLPSATILSRTMPIPMSALPPFLRGDGPMPPTVSHPHDDPRIYRLRMTVDGFQPHELNVAIRQGRLIVRGKHVVCAPSQASPPLTTNAFINGNDDTEPDFVAKEFKRTFTVPSNADIRKAHAHFYPHQQLLVVEIPFQNPAESSMARLHRPRIRPMDVFLTIVTLLLMDRALRITYQQFLLYEQEQQHAASSSSHHSD